MTPFPARFPDLTFVQVAAELSREASQRASFYQRQVDKGKMTREDMRFELALADAWQIDLARMLAAFAPVPHGRPALNPNTAPPDQVAPASHGLPWRARRDGLLRELAFRARVYPRLIAEGKADQPTCQHRTHCLQLLLACYEDGLDWPTDPELRAALCQEVLTRQHGDTPQQELAFA